MKKLLVVICACALVATAGQAGLFKNSVDLADLAELSPESLESLKEIEFAVFVAEVGLNAAKAAERRAAGAVKASGKNLEAENLDMKAAKAELKASKANEDDNRATAAAARISGAEEDMETAKAFRKWKTQEQKARQASVALAKFALDVAEANRDLARARLLKQGEAPSAEKYDLGELDRSVVKRQKEFLKAQSKATAEDAKIAPLKANWERLARNLPVIQGE